MDMKSPAGDLHGGKNDIVALVGSTLDGDRTRVLLETVGDHFYCVLAYWEPKRVVTALAADLFAINQHGRSRGFHMQLNCSLGGGA